ncbi:MAG: ABC transporter substrate-binding protein [Actinomycetota bacterium]
MSSTRSGIRRSVIGLAALSLIVAACGDDGDDADDAEDDASATEVAEDDASGTEPETAEDETTDSEPESTESTSDSSDVGSTEYPLEFTDACGNDLVFDGPPERVHTSSESDTQVLLALGLGDRIEAVWWDFNTGIREDLQSDWDALELFSPSDDFFFPSKEVVLADNPDLIIGGAAFKFDEAEGSPSIADIESIGAQVYSRAADCLNQVDLSIEEQFDFARELGLIFDAQQEAADYIAGIRSDIDDVTAAVADAEPKTAMLYDSGEDPIFTPATAAVAEIFELAGGELVFDEFFDAYAEPMSREVIAATDPEAVLAYIYQPEQGVTPLDERRDFLFGVMENSIAAQQGDFCGVLPRAAGVFLPDYIRDTAACLHPDLVESADIERP